MINERRYKSRPLVSAGRLFLAPIALRNEGPRRGCARAGISGRSGVILACTYAKIMGFDDDRNKRIVERTIINADFTAARRPLNKYEYNRRKDVK